MDWIWKSIVLVLVGIVLLRIAGRKSISQMTVATTVIMISIGTTIVQPIADQHMSKATGSAAVFIVVLLIVEVLEYKFNWIEGLLTGRAVLVIQDGQIQPEKLRSIRMTVDQLEALLRQQGITRFEDVKSATIGQNGQIGYELTPQARPVTLGDLERLLGIRLPQNPSNSIFDEVRNGGHSSAIDPKLH
ncbi:DUF421 domain-containing protein [Paenibacillus rhizovicinus]|uniref:DUF421 domain-containing protein n=1 Tax=Paenibacillus rhizovicinus TaxID=2704463 RepID=A0A6C0NY25_9BACL|nr:YetF domain-containing protein [Paenibacillus rhizovicinus]QHW31130.1 DUF421 domain-containing protein [Paenibacillus rhizovicinus]